MPAGVWRLTLELLIFARSMRHTAVPLALVPPALGLAAAAVRPGGFVAGAAVGAAAVLLAFLASFALTHWRSPWRLDRPVHRATTSEPVIALTFDDGPTPGFTQPILDLLEQFGARGTFFVLGSRAHAMPALVQEVVQRGHEVGNHGWTHDLLLWRSQRFIHRQLDATDRLLKKLGCPGPVPVRAPFGRGGLGVGRELRRTGRRHTLFQHVHWEALAEPGEVVADVLLHLQPGAIIVLHEKPPQRPQVTIEVLRQLLPALGERGYRCVTVSALLGRAAAAGPEASAVAGSNA